MGNHCIIIRAIGPHQNNASYDAEQVAVRAVRELAALGHQVLSAHVETGGTSITITGPGAEPARDVTVDPDGPARHAYERYLHASGGVSLVSGTKLPAWPTLPDSIKAAWRAAADPGAPRLVE